MNADNNASDMKADANKDPDRLEREIDEQRREINETLRALEEKFSSRELANYVTNYVGGHGREWADTLVGSVKANPLATLLTAVGVTWLMMSDRQASNRYPYYVRGSRGYDFAPDDYEGERSGMYSDGTYVYGDDYMASDYEGAGGSSLREKAGEMGEKAAHAREALGEKASHAREALGEKASHVRERLHDKAAHAREAMRSRAAYARRGMGNSRMAMRDNFGQVRDVAREQPLALGAIGIALGALIGAALPRTEHENRMLGRASERVKQRGKEMAREGYERAQQKAAEVADKASQKASEVAEVASDKLQRRLDEGSRQGSTAQQTQQRPADTSGGLG